MPRRLRSGGRAPPKRLSWSKVCRLALEADLAAAALHGDLMFLLVRLVLVPLRTWGTVLALGRWRRLSLATPATSDSSTVNDGWLVATAVGPDSYRHRGEAPRDTFDPAKTTENFASPNFAIISTTYFLRRLAFWGFWLGAVVGGTGFVGNPAVGPDLSPLGHRRGGRRGVGRRHHARQPVFGVRDGAALCGRWPPIRHGTARRPRISWPFCWGHCGCWSAGHWFAGALFGLCWFARLARCGYAALEPRAAMTIFRRLVLAEFSRQNLAPYCWLLCG